MVDVIRGYDPKDSVTVTQLGYASPTPLYAFSHAPSLRGKRLGIVREFMPKHPPSTMPGPPPQVDPRLQRREVIPILRSAGAELVEIYVNARDVANGWQVDDLGIPNFSNPGRGGRDGPGRLEPAFANPSTQPAPSLTTGLTRANTCCTAGLRPTTVPALFSPGTDIIKQSVAMFYGGHGLPRRHQPAQARPRCPKPAPSSRGDPTAWIRCSAAAAAP